MKTLIIATILAVLTTAGTTVRGQDMPEEYLGLPGDNLNLYAVMDLFQESKTLEEFENKLNAKDSRINNLDLNGDNYVDYITVTDFVDGKIHTIVLRAVLGKDEYQDVGVFIVERLRKGQLRIQLIGDEALYGKNYIIEPRSETPNPGYGEDVYYGENVTVINNIYYYDLSWPIFDWIFMSDYVAWHSGWYWGYWPSYWSPWSPWYWHQYYGYHSNWYPHYRDYYRHWNHPAHRHYNDYYYNNIRYHSAQVERRKTEGHYKETYSRPDTRRDGEALYESVRDTRRTDESSGDERTRVAAGEESRRSSGTVTREKSEVTDTESRRSPEAAGGRTRVSTEQNAEESRRPTYEVRGSKEGRPTVSGTSQESRRQQRTTIEEEDSPEVPVRSTTSPASVERNAYEAPSRTSSPEVPGSAPARSSSTSSERTYSAPERSSTSAPSRSSSGSTTYSAPERSTTTSAPARSSSTSSERTYSAPERSSTSSAPARSSGNSESSYSAPSRSSSNTSTSAPERSTSTSAPEKSSTETGTAPATRRR